MIMIFIIEMVKTFIRLISSSSISISAQRVWPMMIEAI